MPGDGCFAGAGRGSDDNKFIVGSHVQRKGKRNQIIPANETCAIE
jgi:hypothetical protein